VTLAACPDIDWRWCAEIDPFASAVLAARFPDVPNFGDVTKVDWDAVEPVDLLVFGTPCQGFSVAGKRLGLADPRSNLVLVALQVARRVRPRWLVFENVPGLLSNWSGAEECGPRPGNRWEGVENSDFATFLGAVRECGYLGCWASLDAQWFGVPQRRERLFFVGCLGDWRPPAQVLAIAESLRGDSPPSREAGEGAAHSIEGGANGSVAGYRGDGSDKLIPFNNTGQGWWNDSEAAQAIRTDKGSGARESTLIAFQSNYSNQGIKGDRPTLTENRATAVAHVADPISAHEARTYTHEGRNNFRLRNVVPAIYGGNRQSGPLDFETETFITHALDSFSAGRMTEDGTGRGCPIVTHALRAEGFDARGGLQVRRLVPEEAEALQGFPRGWTAVQYRGKPAADGNRYRALGNAMCVDVVKWILDRIRSFDED
jgi:DNA (cytosine-5)-methyltransferase 1